MMEHNTDRLFWTLTSIIIGALLLTISVKVFPSVANTITAPLQGIIQQGDSSTKTADQAFKDTTNNNSNSQSSQQINLKTQTENSVDENTLNLKVIPNGDGTGILVGTISGIASGALNIPEYVKVNGQPTQITSIGHHAFAANQISSLTIPNSVKDIEYNAFYFNKLTSINIPHNVVNIGDDAFDSNQLTSATIGNNVTNIGNNAFQNNKLTSINIPNTVIKIGDDAFYNNQLTSVIIGNNVTSIGNNAFYANLVNSVNIPNTQGYQSAKSNKAFQWFTDISNHPSN